MMKDDAWLLCFNTFCVHKLSSLVQWLWKLISSCRQKEHRASNETAEISSRTRRWKMNVRQKVSIESYFFYFICVSKSGKEIRENLTCWPLFFPFVEFLRVKSGLKRENKNKSFSGLVRVSENTKKYPHFGLKDKLIPPHIHNVITHEVFMITRRILTRISFHK